MNILITHQSQEGKTHCFELTCGNKSAFISIHTSPFWVTVCCKNAAHRVWRGSGRTFHSYDEALAAYRSPEMHSMIEGVRNELSQEVAS